MGQITVELLPTQAEFIQARNKYCLYSGSLGGGKSFALCCWIIYNAIKYPTCTGLITALTYKQLNRATLQTLFKLLTDCGISFQYKSNGELTIGDHLVYCTSMENYDTLRGIEIGYAACDEFCYYSPDSVNVLIGRLRDKRGPLQLKAASTPNGFNFAYDLFVANANENTFITYASAYDNIHLPREYISSLEQQYDERLAEQEIKGRFVSLTSGKIYYSFDRNINVADLGNVSGGIWLACDFNVNPLCSVNALVREDLIYVTDEIYLKDSNTFALADSIKSKWGSNLRIIPDSTGNSRRTSSSKSDHQILKDSGLTVVYNHNPLVKDRYNCVNNLLNKKKLIIHPKCKMLIKDLEQLLYDNRDPMLSHISDALGYMAWYLMPIARPATPTQIISVRK